MHVRLQIGFTLLRVYFISNFDTSGVLMDRLVALCVFLQLYTSSWPFQGRVGEGDRCTPVGRRDYKSYEWLDYALLFRGVTFPGCDVKTADCY